MRVVAGGVVGETGYAVGGSLPTGNGKGWQGALTEFPRYTLFSNSRLQQTVLSQMSGLRAPYWITATIFRCPAACWWRPAQGLLAACACLSCAPPSRPPPVFYRLNTQICQP